MVRLALKACLALALVMGTMVAFAACSSDEDAGPANNGVNDVRRACEIRVTWKSPLPIACSDCLGVSAAPRCDCSDKDYAGACRAQQEAEIGEPTCDGVRACANTCAPGDCNCLEGCFAGKEACRARASALDGCLAETCAKYCQ